MNLSIYFNDLGLILVFTLYVILGRSPLLSLVPHLELAGTVSSLPASQFAVRTKLR